MITKLKENEIFVFGSNVDGKHDTGAAKYARNNFGAEDGVGEGLTGHCYAFPELDEYLSQRTLRDIKDSVEELYEACELLPEYKFIMDKVCCGPAGYEEEMIQSFFSKPPKNLVLPLGWSRAIAKIKKNK